VEDKISVLARKFDGSIHRQWKAKLINQDSTLIILYGVFDLDVKHPSLGFIRKGTHSIEYYWKENWYNVFIFFEPNGELRNYYCNINIPPNFDGEILSFIDLDLDIMISNNFNITVLDEDEFESNAKKYNYPNEIKQKAKKTLTELLALIKRREFPFDIQTRKYHVNAYY
jgi:protein associated with RNAse G/E